MTCAFISIDFIGLSYWRCERCIGKKQWSKLNTNDFVSNLSDNRNLEYVLGFGICCNCIPFLYRMQFNKSIYLLFLAAHTTPTIISSFMSSSRLQANSTDNMDASLLKEGEEDILRYRENNVCSVSFQGSFVTLSSNTGDFHTDVDRPSPLQS